MGMEAGNFVELLVVEAQVFSTPGNLGLLRSVKYVELPGHRVLKAGLARQFLRWNKINCVLCPVCASGLLPHPNHFPRSCQT